MSNAVQGRITRCALTCLIAALGWLLAVPAVPAYGQESGQDPPGTSPGGYEGGNTSGPMSAAPGGYEGQPASTQTPEVFPATGQVPTGESFTPEPGASVTPQGASGLPAKRGGP